MTNNTGTDYEGYDLDEDEDDEIVEDTNPELESYEDFKMDEDDDDEDAIEDLSQEEESQPQISELDALVVKIAEIKESKNLDLTKLRYLIFDTELRKTALSHGLSYDDMLLGTTPQDKNYNDLFVAMFPAMKSILASQAKPQQRPNLIKCLTETLDRIIQTSEPEESKESDTDELLEEDEVDEAEVENVVTAVLKVYDSLYGPCFLSRPKGILTAKGILVFDEKSQKPKILATGKTFAKSLYGAVNGASDGVLGTEVRPDLISSSYFDANGNVESFYSPMYHLFNAMGLQRLADGSFKRVNKWAEYRIYLKKDLEYKVTNVLKNVKREDTLSLQRDLITLFTNCVILVDFDIVRAFELRYSINGVASNLGDIILRQSEALFAKPFGEVISNEHDEFRVYNLLYVFDKEAYTSEILFSYKAYENMIRSGNKPDLKNVIVGKLLDGKDYTVNLDDNTVKAIGIQAGSRSGKGVLTLNIMASILANGNPLLYLDYKPDMSSALWDMERKINAEGHNARIFSIDALGGKTKSSSPVRYYPFGMNAPSDLPLDSTEWALFPYLKTLQLFALLVEMRHKEMYNRDKKIFVIMDEMQGFSKAYMPMIAKLQEYAKDERKKAGKGGEVSETVNLAERIATIFGNQLKTNLTAVRDVTGGTGKAAMILLGQKVNPDEWAVDVIEGGRTRKLPWKESFAATLLASTDLKLIGKNAGAGTVYGLKNLNSRKTPGADLVDSEDTRGYWVATSAVQPTDDSSKVFKSYLTLNENDFDLDEYNANGTRNLPYTGGVLSGISRELDIQRVIYDDFLDKDGNVRESVGLFGLMKLITPQANELAENVSQGYMAMNQLFMDLGFSNKYSCIEEYLHDASPDSFYAYAELKDILTGASESDDSDIDETFMGDPDENPAYVNPSAVANQTQGTQQPSQQGESNHTGTLDWGDEDRKPVNNGDLPEYNPIKIVGEATPPNAVDPLKQPIIGGIPDENALEGVQETGAMDSRFNVPNPAYENPAYENPEYMEDPTNMPYTAQDAEIVQHALKYDLPVSPNDVEERLPQYKEKIHMDFNPFKRSRNTAFNSLNAVKMISDRLLREISSATGGLDRVEIVEFTATHMIINNIVFKPQFNAEFVQDLPFEIKYQVEQGNITELFFFGDLKKFPNMMVLRIDDLRLAEGRVRREVGISPRADWYRVYYKYRNLRELYIAGTKISTPEEAMAYEQNGRNGYDMEQQIINNTNPKHTNSKPSTMQGVWSSPTANMMTGTLGSNLGSKAMFGLATFFGAWGAFFGALKGSDRYANNNQNQDRR